MDNIEYIVTLITSIIVTGTLIYKTLFKNNYKREKNYYANILQPAIQILKYDKNANITKSLKEVVKFSDDNIPKYIFYLISQNNNDKLKKILIYDYFDIYDNDDNRVSRMIRISNKVVFYAFIFLVFVFIIFGSITIYSNLVLLVYSFNSDIKANISILGFTINTYIFNCIFGTFLWGIGFILICFAKWWNTDRYTLKIEKMEKIIEKKIRIYNKNNSKFFY